MLKHLTVILAKLEVTYNTDPVPVGTDAVLVENPSWSFDSTRRFERNPAKASLAPMKGIYGGSLKTITFETEIKGSGSAGVAPEISALLQACGCAETIVGGTSVTYKPSSTVSTHKSVTIYYYEDGLRRIITGARGTFQFNGEVGMGGKISWTFTGHYSDPTDVALVTPTYDSTVPVVMLGLSSFLVDSYAAKLTKIAFDIGNTLAKPGDITQADGFGEVRISGRNVTGSLDPEQTLVATYNWVNKWKTNVSGALDTGVIGTVAGNRWRVTMPALNYLSLGPADKEGISTFDLQFEARESTSDDDFSFIYT
jgi:hypothetical protein